MTPFNLCIGLPPWLRIVFLAISDNVAGRIQSYYPSRHGGIVHVLSQFHFHNTFFAGMSNSYSIPAVKGSTLVLLPTVSRIHSIKAKTSVTSGAKCREESDRRRYRFCNASGLKIVVVPDLQSPQGSACGSHPTLSTLVSCG